MAVEGLTVEVKEGIAYLTGSIDEYSEYDSLLAMDAPLRLNLSKVGRINSIGVRNFLKFLNDWGSKDMSYIGCTVDFVDQLNMIPSLSGINGHIVVESALVPFECDDCDTEKEILNDMIELAKLIKSGDDLPARKCDCGGEMYVLMDSFFVFLER
jgi:hypothetical protein